MAVTTTGSSVLVTIPPTTIADGIFIYNPDSYNDWFEKEYSSNAEPWSYSNRGAELYRHRYTLQQLRKYNARPKSVLELGSSKGLMTVQLMDFCDEVVASDISLTAIRACKQRCEAKQHTDCKLSYFVTTVPGLPFADNSLDVVTVCDGMEGWWFSDDKKKEALKDVHRVLKKGGIAVITDFFMADGNIRKFMDYESIIRNSPLSIVSISHLYDRPWYLLESIAKKTKLQKLLRRLLSSVAIAKGLNRIGKMMGRKLSNHVVIIARKD